RYASWFDVIWHTPTGHPSPLRLPILADPRPIALARRNLRLTQQSGNIRLRYGDSSFPLDPTTVAPLLERWATAPSAEPPASRERPGARRAERLSGSERGAPPAARDAPDAPALDAVLASLAPRDLERLLERQHYRLVHWRRAAGDVNYRRFFAVSELVGL